MPDSFKFIHPHNSPTLLPMLCFASPYQILILVLYTHPQPYPHATSKYSFSSYLLYPEPPYISAKAS